MALPVLVINRDRDTERLAGFRGSARDFGVLPIRVPALDAHDPAFPFDRYASLIRDHFWGRSTIKPGAVGCFLSHRAAWQTILDADWPAAIVAEDDAALLGDPVQLAPLFAAPDAPEVLFVNHRLPDWASHAGVTDNPAPLPDVMAGVARLGGPEALNLRSAPGAYGYAVSRVGAERLLAATDAIGIVCGVDWAIVWSSLPAGSVGSGIAELDMLRQRVPPPERPVHAAIWGPGLFGLRKGPSVIRHAIEVPIAGLSR